MNTVGEAGYKVVEGGFIHEFPNATINSEEILLPYTTKFVQFFRRLSAKTKKLIGGNISGVNLFKTDHTKLLITALDVFLQEDYLKVAIGFTGYFGLQKTWDTAVFAALNNKSSVIQGMIEAGASRKLDRKRRDYWERDQASLLAMYYLINQERNSFVEWGNGFYYGSGNTESWNYYKEGVPKNIAYQPTNMMKIDIGIPDQVFVPGREYMTYQYKTVEGGDYTVIGNTSSTSVKHAELSVVGETTSDDLLVGELPIVPTYVYYVEGSVPKYHSSVKTTPLEGVACRNYSKGIVMFRTDTFGYSTEFLKTNVTVQLPSDGEYKEINFDGSLGSSVTETLLHGYQGKVFARIQPTSSPTPVTTFSPTPRIYCDEVACQSNGDSNAFCVYGDHCSCSIAEGFVCATEPTDGSGECQQEILCVPSLLVTPSSAPSLAPTVGEMFLSLSPTTKIDGDVDSGGSALKISRVGLIVVGIAVVLV